MTYNNDVSRALQLLPALAADLQAWAFTSIMSVAKQLLNGPRPTPGTPEAESVTHARAWHAIFEPFSDYTETRPHWSSMTVPLTGLKTTADEEQDCGVAEAANYGCVAAKPFPKYSATAGGRRQQLQATKKAVGRPRKDPRWTQKQLQAMQEANGVPREGIPTMLPPKIQSQSPASLASAIKKACSDLRVDIREMGLAYQGIDSSRIAEFENQEISAVSRLKRSGVRGAKGITLVGLLNMALYGNNRVCMALDMALKSLGKREANKILSSAWMGNSNPERSNGLGRGPLSASLRESAGRKWHEFLSQKYGTKSKVKAHMIFVIKQKLHERLTNNAEYGVVSKLVTIVSQLEPLPVMHTSVETPQPSRIEVSNYDNQGSQQQYAPQQYADPREVMEEPKNPVPDHGFEEFSTSFSQS